MILKRFLVISTIILLLAAAVPAYAQEGDEETVLPCTGETVTGTVVAVDEETGVLTLSTEDGLCTVTMDGEYEHPIVSLLGAFFGETNVTSLAAALDATNGCVILDEESDTYVWADCDTEGAIEVTITSDNGDGTFTTTITVDDEEIEISVVVDDPEVAEELASALGALTVEWALGEEGNALQAGDEIAAYHDEGIGFGVLVKLYSMAINSMTECAGDATEPCGVTVQDLVDAFNSGTGLGQLFREYGRPSHRGVGHVRHASDSSTEEADADAEGSGGPPDHSNAGGNNGGGPPDHSNAGGNGNGGGPPDHSNAGGNGNGRGK